MPRTPTPTLDRLTARERHAVFAAACELEDISRTEAATRLGYSWWHIKEWLDGSRVASAELTAAVEKFIEPARELGARVALPAVAA